MADTDPLEYRQRSHPDLDIVTHGLTLWDLDREFATGGFGGKPMMKLRDILGVLRDSYCRTIGIEYMHIQDPERAALDPGARRASPHDKPDREEQLRILRRLNAAEAFETFLQTKYVGQKRFSLEGGESVIPLLDAVLDRGRRGRPRRGRASACRTAAGSTCSPTSSARATGRSSASSRATTTRESVHGSGDVKYHLGAEGTFTAPDGSDDQGLPRRQPLPPGGGRPGARGHRPRQAGHPQQGRGRLHRAAGAAARRRGVRRPGRGGRDAEPVAAARLPHRRHRPHRRQQPGRLHDRRRRRRARRSTAPTWRG